MHCWLALIHDLTNEGMAFTGSGIVPLRASLIPHLNWLDDTECQFNYQLPDDEGVCLPADELVCHNHFARVWGGGSEIQ